MVKSVSAQLQAHLDSRATKMIYCWKVTRNDGLAQGFTDHDNDLIFDGLTYRAATGFTASQFASALGLAVDNLEVQGGLSSDSLNEADLAAGHYDNATVEIYWVNWGDISQRHLVSRGFIGEVKRHGSIFSAEIRGLSNALQQKVGRRYQRYCDAIVGDTRCKIDLSSSVYLGTGTVSIVTDNRVFQATGLGTFADDWFSAGMLTWVTGDNASGSMEVKVHKLQDGVVTLDLWQPMPATVNVADTFEITVGCKQDSTTCASKFNNIANFRGFNLIPGPDTLLFYPKLGDDNLDGQSLFS